MFNLDGWGNNECLNNRKKAEATQNKTKQRPSAKAQNKRKCEWAKWVSLDEKTPLHRCRGVFNDSISVYNASGEKLHQALADSLDRAESLLSSQHVHF